MRRRRKSNFWLWVSGATLVYVAAQTNSAETERLTSGLAREISSDNQYAAAVSVIEKQRTVRNHATQTGTKAESTKYGQVTASRLNVRRSPSKSSLKIGGLARGTVVRILDTEGQWVRVLGEDAEGWVFSSYLAATTVTETAPEKDTSSAATSTPGVADSQARQSLIRQSIANYSGNCPCPYNITANGSRCGGRSAYSRPGGESPLCYERDISEQQLARFLRNP